jgi:hypothetical protein
VDILRRLRQHKREQAALQPGDEKTRLERPFLWELLTMSQYGNGQLRWTATVKITRVPGAWSVVLQDDEEQLQCRTEVQELEYVWDALEALLCDPSVIWTPFKSFKPRHPKVKGKRKKD